MLASLINNPLMAPSLGTRPASAAPSVGRAWSPQMSQTKMGSFIAKVRGCGDFPGGSCAMLRGLPMSARNQTAQLGSLGSWKVVKPPNRNGAAPVPRSGLWAPAQGFRTKGIWEGDKEEE